MTALLTWSKYARREAIPHTEPDYRKIGYIEQAITIADKPGAFADEDIEKAIRIFLGQQMDLAAKTLRDTYMRLRRAREEERAA